MTDRDEIELQLVNKMFRDGIDIETICQALVAMVARGNKPALDLVMQIVERRREINYR